MKEGFIPAEFKTTNSHLIPSIVKAKYEASTAKFRSIEPQTSDEPDPDYPCLPAEGGTLSALTTVKIADQDVDALLDTGASVNLINFDTLYALDHFPKIRRYSGRLESANGKPMEVLGRARIRVRVGKIDEDVNFLVLHDVNPAIILGLAFLNNHNSNLDFSTKQFWTGPAEDSIVSFRVEQIRRIRGLIVTEPE